MNNKEASQLSDQHKSAHILESNLKLEKRLEIQAKYNKMAKEISMIPDDSNYKFLII